jgi:hypothetical protein
MRILLLAGAALLLLGAQPASTSYRNVTTVDLCTLLSHPVQYTGKRVRVTGFVYADRHVTAVGSDKCDGLLVLRYDNKALPPNFISGVEAKRGKRDNRPFRVIIQGKIERPVCRELGCLTRIAVTRVVDAKFSEPLPTKPPASQPRPAENGQETS